MNHSDVSEHNMIDEELIGKLVIARQRFQAERQLRARIDDDWIESLLDRLAKPARFQRLKSLRETVSNLRKLLIQLGLFVLAAGLVYISSIFGDLTPSF